MSNHEHPNLTRARTGYEAFGKGDLDAVKELFADDIVWHATVAGPLNGDYKGVDEVLGFFGKLMQETGGTFKQEIHDLLANDEHGVGIVSVSAERNGKRLDGARSVHVFHMKDGKMTEFWVAPLDGDALAEFWA